MKKSIIFLGVFILLLTTLVAAQEAKLEVTTLKDAYISNENISIRVSLLDISNKPIDSQIQLFLIDVEKRSTIETSVTSNKIASVSLGEKAPSGFWEIIAIYEGQEASTTFLIESEELAEFTLEGDNLIITNVGNTRYEKTIQIIIGDTVGIKSPSLDIGESTTFRLIAPAGEYNVRVTDGTSSIVQGGVQLTGEVIGILDDRVNQRTPITGGGPENLQGSSYSFFRQNSLVYIFVVAVVGAAILIAIERHYRRKVRE